MSADRRTLNEIVTILFRVVSRQVALTCILITAGLGLDAKTLKKLSLVVLELSFIPCIFEAIGVAIFCKLLLQYSWLWGLLIG